MKKSEINNSRLLISVIAPMYNEEESIEAFLVTLRKVLDSLDTRYEVILVNDGSTDQTVERVRSLKWKNVSVLSFVSNSGHMAALDAGIRAATGDYLITMDSDLQHPPQLIPELVNEAILTSSDVVYAVRSSRAEESFFKRTSANLYYKAMSRASGVDLVPSAADFRLISSRVATVVRSIPLGNNVFRILIPSLGFPYSTVPYIAAPRFGGDSKYKIGKMVSLAVTSIVGYSTRPLQVATIFGMFLTAASFVGLIYVAIVFFAGRSLEGWASLASISLLMFGLVFLMLGIIGRYLAEVLHRLNPVPKYLVESDDNSGGFSRGSR